MEIKLMGEVLKTARKSKGFSRDKLMIELNQQGIEASTHLIQKWESGHTTRQVIFLFALCRLLDIKLDELILIKEESNDNIDPGDDCDDTLANRLSDSDIPADVQ